MKKIALLTVVFAILYYGNLYANEQKIPTMSDKDLIEVLEARVKAIDSEIKQTLEGVEKLKAFMEQRTKLIQQLYGRKGRASVYVKGD